MATLGTGAAEREAIETFRRDVVEPSMTSLVILDFHSDRSPACKQLAPVLDRIAADYAARGVLLVRIDADKDRVIAAQFRVQSLPTVYALFQGQLVADLTTARTDAQLRATLDQILKQIPVESAEGALQQDIAPLIAMGEEVLEDGDAERAISIFSQIAEMAPDDPVVAAGLARALLLSGRPEEAEAALDALPADKAKDGAVARARAAISLARDAKPVDDLAGLRDRITADGDDHAARFELAGGLMASGDREGAADALLEIIARERDWNDGAARAQLLKLFEAVGLGDPWVSAQRRRLSALLFT